MTATHTASGKRAASVLGLACVAVSLLCPVAIAQTVIHITGTVTQTANQGNVLPSGISVGDAVTVTVTFGTPTTSSFNSSNNTQSYTFGSANLTLQTTIGSYTWTTADSTTISMRNNAANGPGPVADAFDVSSSTAFGSPASFPGALGTNQATLTLQDGTSTYDLVTGLSLPTSTSDLNLSAATSFTGTVQSSFGAAQSWSVTYSINSLSVSSVPEPSAYALIIGAGGLVAAGIAAKRRTRASQHPTHL